MSLLGLAFRSIAGNPFRSCAVSLCVLGVAAFSLSTTLIVRGAERSLRLGLDRLGADIVVVPEGAETQMESALFTGRPATVWMPEEKLRQIAAISGVGVASPQLYLGSVREGPGQSGQEVFLVAFDPASDFTIRPWLERGPSGELGRGEAVAGGRVSAPQGLLSVQGYQLALKYPLEPTGTGLDQTVLFSMETAREMVAQGVVRGFQGGAEIPPGSISAVMVRAAPGAEVHAVALNIVQGVLGITPIESPDIYKAFRRQMDGLVQGGVAVLSIVWGLSALAISLVFSAVANERRREMAVLRALGATRGFIFRSLLAEAALLALSGGAVGVVLAALGTYLLGGLIVSLLEIPYLVPTPAEFLALSGAGLALPLLIVPLAALLPALRVSRQEPALAMRE